MEQEFEKKKKSLPQKYRVEGEDTKEIAIRGQCDRVALLHTGCNDGLS